MLVSVATLEQKESSRSSRQIVPAGFIGTLSFTPGRLRTNLRQMKPLRVGLIGYDDVQALDLIGPSDAFSIPMQPGPNGKPQPFYEVVIIGLSAKSFRTESGILMKPHCTLDAVARLDTLIIPGGRGIRTSRIGDVIAKWIRREAKAIRRVASVCTGIYALASTGLLDGRKVTTHWRFAPDVTRRFPRLRVNPDALFLKEGRFYTAGGITASIDLSLALIEEDLGPAAALSVARELVVYLKRSGGQKQYSEPLEFQIQSSDRFSDLAAWLPTHLQADLSLPALAKRANLSPRQFHRRFKKTFAQTPAHFVQNLRLEEARRRLSERTQTVESVALSVGFQSDDAFRWAFQKRFGIGPRNYRNRFNARASRW
jgi:transcriptional regulator GlxA family with amidase domain